MGTRNRIEDVFILFLLVIWILIHCSVAALNVPDLHLCPKECSCFTELDDVVVNCSAIPLESLPKQFPLETTTLLLKYKKMSEIPGHSFQKYSKIRYINLSFDDQLLNNSDANWLTIHNDSLLGLNHLEKLVISDNSVRNLRVSCDKPFRDLVQLKYLELGTYISLTNKTCFDLAIRDLNNLKHLKITWTDEKLTLGFSFLRKLKILDLTKSTISVTRSSFAVLINLPLERLSLRNVSSMGFNKTSQNYVSFEPLALSDLKSLKIVDLSVAVNNFKAFQWVNILQSFQNTSTLHTLIMDNFAIDFSSFDYRPGPFPLADIFAPLKHTKLVQLSIQCNGISVLDNSFLNFLHHQKNLEYLSLKYNTLNFGNFKLQPNGFIHNVLKGKIKELHVSYQSSPMHIFFRCPSENPLFLDTNLSNTRSSRDYNYETSDPIQSFSSRASSIVNATASNMIALERLFIDNNLSLGSRIDNFMVSVVGLLVYMNKNTFREEGHISVTTQLQYLDFSSSSIPYIYDTVQFDQDPVFTYFDHLKELKLDDNLIDFVHFNLFNKWLPNLQTLRLSKNRFGSFRNKVYMKPDVYLTQEEYLSKTFSDLNHLEFLDLNNNMLEVLYEGMFENCSKLETLKVAENNMRAVKVSFTKVPNLKELDLSGNLLTGLNQTQIKELENIASQHEIIVKLDENQNLQCTCDYITFITWIQDSERKTQIPNVSNLTCITTRGEVVKVSEMGVHGLHLECIKKDLLIGCITSSTCVLLISLFLWYQRWTLKYWYYKYKVAKKARNIDNEQPLIDYDAYICYPDVDYEWANYIRQNLEGELNLNVFFPERDFIPGGNIYEETVRGIEASKKILLCINENYDDVGFQNFVVQMSCVRGKGFVIPIIRGEIPVNRLPRVLRHLLRDDVYLDWPHHKAGEEKFWKDLEKAIKSRKGVFIEKNGCGVYYGTM